MDEKTQVVAMDGGIPFLPVGEVAGATVVSRWQGRVRVTVIVKATFAFVDGGEMVPAPAVGLGAGDLFPYLPRVDVLFTGKVHPPPGVPAGAVAVRLALAGESRPLLDKRLVVGGAAAVDLGPVDPPSPARARLLRGLPRAAMEGAMVELPDDIAWDTLQAAPPDRQVSVLQGRVWIRLEGLSARHPVLQMCLLPLRALARLEARGVPVQQIELRADTLSIDGDAERVSVTFRTGHAVDEAALAGLTVSGGIDLPQRPVAWSALPAPAEPPRAAQPELAASTLAVTDLADLRARLPLPFQPGVAPPLSSPWASRPPPAITAREASGTLEIADDDPRAAALRVLPFGELPPPSPPPVRHSLPAPLPVPAIEAPPPAPAPPPADPPPPVPAPAPPPVITTAADAPPEPPPPPKRPPPAPAPPGASPDVRQGLYGMFTGFDD